jgi:hypothetical protein
VGADLVTMSQRGAAARAVATPTDASRPTVARSEQSRPLTPIHVCRITRIAC